MAYVVDVAKLNMGGKVFATGDRIDLSSKQAAKLLAKAYIRFDNLPQKVVQVVSQPDARKAAAKLIPEGKSVEDLKKLIKSIEDIDTLEKMIEEEKQGLNRKTLIEAIEKKIDDLNESSDDEGNEDLNLNMDPDEVINNG